MFLLITLAGVLAGIVLGKLYAYYMVMKKVGKITYKEKNMELTTFRLETAPEYMLIRQTHALRNKRDRDSIFNQNIHVTCVQTLDDTFWNAETVAEARISEPDYEDCQSEISEIWKTSSTQK